MEAGIARRARRGLRDRHEAGRILGVLRVIWEVVWRLQWGEVNRWEFLMLLIAGGLDIESVGQRIVELVELAVREHLEGVGRSQAERLMNMVEEEASEGWREE